MQKTISKILSCLLALVMVLGLLPVSSLAAETAAAAIYKNGVLQASYADVQSAVDNSNGGVIVLQKSVSEDIIVSGEVYLDLNGKTLTGNVSGTGTLYGMDSANDTYDAAKNGRIAGTVSCAVASNCKNNATLKRYVAIADADGYSFHRIYAGITKQSLAPSVTGVGYKAEFYGDSVVQSQVESIGYNLWLEGGKTVSRSAAFKNELTLRVKNFDVVNFGETNLYATACITIGGEKIVSSEYSLTLRQVVEAVNADVGAYSETQLDAVRSMIENNPVMASWNVANILNKNAGLVTVTFSDVQLVTTHRGTTVNGPKSLKDHLNYAKSIDADVLFMPGDIVNNADQSYYDRFWSIFKSVYGTDESAWPELVWTMGNHEWYDLNEKNATNAISMFKSNARIHTENLVKMSQVTSETNPDETVANYYKVIQGVPFVVISGDSSSMRVSDAQKAELIGWLDEINQLPSVKAGAPIYVAYHGPIADVTFFGQGASDASKVVDEILKNYPNTIVFTGHTHYSNVNERTINQVDYTAINLGSSSYTRLASRGAASQPGDKYDNAGGSDKDVVNGEVAFGLEYIQSLMVLKNYTDGSVAMDRYVTDSNADDARKVGITWNFPAGLTKDQFTYTNDRFQNKQWANTLYGKDGLVFPDNAAIAYSVDGTEMMVYFDDVTDHNYAEHYKITVTADGKTAKTYDMVGNYYKFYTQPQTYHFRLTDIPAGTNYTVEVKAYDFFDNESLNSLVATTKHEKSLFADVIDEAFVETYTDISTKVNYETTAGDVSSVECYYRGDYLYSAGATLGTVIDKENPDQAKAYSVTNWSHGILTVKVKNVGDVAVNVGLSVVLDNNGDNKWITDFGSAYHKVVEANGQWTELRWDLQELFGIISLDKISFIRIKVGSTAPSADGYAMHLYLDDIDVVQGENVIDPEDVIRGEIFSAGQGLTKIVEDGQYNTVSFEYKLTSEGKISLFLRGADKWLNSYGDFEFNANGAAYAYDGVTTEKLEDGYIRVTMNVAKLTDIYNNKPNGLCALEIFGSWTTAGGYLDKVVFSTESVPDEPVLEDIHAFTAGKSTTIGFENAPYKMVTFDYQLSGNGTMYVILRDEDHWGSLYYGDFKFNANGEASDYAGVTTEKLSNGYIHVTMILAELNRSGVSNNRDKAPTNVGVFDIYSWTDVNGTVANIKFLMDESEAPETPDTPDEPVIRGERFEAGNGWSTYLSNVDGNTVTPAASISFDYKLDGEANGDSSKKMALILRRATSGNWTNSYVDYSFGYAGARYTYDNVTCELLDDGYIHVTIDLTGLDYDDYGVFDVYGSWCNVGGYVDNIQCQLVGQEEAPSFSEVVTQGQEFTAGKNMTIYFEENDYDVVTFDYKFTSGTKFWFGLYSADWKQYYGAFKLDANGVANTYAGVSSEKLDNGLIRVTMQIDALTRTNSADNLNNAPEAIALLSVVASWSDADGLIDNVRCIKQGEGNSGDDVKDVIRGEAFTEAKDKSIVVDAQNYEAVYFDYKITSGNRLAIGLYQPDWMKYYGIFNFNANGAEKAYPGVSYEKLDDGYIRVKLVTVELTRTKNQDNLSNIPDTFNRFYIYGSGTTANGYVDNVQFIEQGKMTYDFTANADSVIHCREGRYEQVSFNYTIESGDKLAVALKNPAGTKYYGSFHFTAGGEAENYAGITTTKMSDGSVNVVIDVDQLNRTGDVGNTDLNPTTINGLYVLGGNTTASGSITAAIFIEATDDTVYRGVPMLAGGDLKLDMGVGVYSQLQFDYIVTNDSPFSVSFLGTDGKYYGYYQFDGNGETQDYAGITTRILEDGYIQVTLNVAQLTKTNNADNRNNAPAVLQTMVIHGAQSTANGYIDNIKTVAGEREIIRGKKLSGAAIAFEKNAAAYGSVTLDYKITSGELQVVLVDEKGTASQTYTFTTGGEKHDYAGVSVALREDGYQKITFTRAALANAPAKIAEVRVLANSTAVGYVDNAQFINATGTARIGVLSDIHLGDDHQGANDANRQTQRFERVLNAYKNMGVDAIVISGDLADHGTLAEKQAWMEVFAQTWLKVFPNNTNPLTGEHVEPVFIYGNHDSQMVDAAWWPESLGEYKPGYMTNVNGYYFVAAQYTEEFAATDYLMAARQDSEGNPFFYIQHCDFEGLLYNHTNVDHGTGRTALDDLWNDSNAIVLSGHTHFTAADERSIWQPSNSEDPQFTSLSVPSINYGRVADEYSLAGDTNAIIQGMYMVLGGTQVDVTRLTFHDETDADGEQIGSVWSWDAADPADKPYGYETRAEAANKPVFASGAKISVTKQTGTSTTISFNAATVNAPAGFSDLVLGYRVDVVDKATGEVVSSQIVTTPYHLDGKASSLPNTYHATIDGLTAGISYEIRVYAMECYQVESDPLTLTLKLS